MDSSQATEKKSKTKSSPAAFNPFKSKKIIQSSSKSLSAPMDDPQTQASDPITPQKSLKMKSSPAAFNPFKSKKIIQSSSKSLSAPMDDPQTQASDPITPQKSIQLPSRNRNGGVVYSLRGVRIVTEGLRESKKAESSKQPDPIIASITPSKRKKPISVKLPEKYGLLVDFFDSMESSIRLLNLKGTMTSFSNISAAVESLKDRRFTYAHLAQLKHILPEGIILKKIRVHDERTLCMKPDLQITLQNDAIENPKVRSGFVSLRKEFHSRVVDFSKRHPEGDDVPEATLPEPFNRTKQVVLPSEPCSLPKQVVLPSEPCSLPLPIVSSPSTTLPLKNSALVTHLAPSFQRRFSQRNFIPESEKTPLLSTSKPPKPHFNLSCSKETPYPVVPSPIKCSSKLPIIKTISTIDAYPVKVPPSSPLPSCVETKIKRTEDCSPADIDAIKGTPVKLISTPARLMASTPDLQTPKRCRMYQDDDSTASPSKLARRPTNRSLFTTPMKNMKPETEMMNEEESSSADLDSLKLLPETLVQSIRDNGRRIREEQESDISRAKFRKRMIAALPKMYDMILLIFQSIKRSVVTKEELIHKIIASHCDIVDRSEVEEQLKLLREFIPEYIWEKVASTGDILLCINKMLSVESSRRRLAEAE